MAEATLLTHIRELEARIAVLEAGYAPAPDGVYNVLAFNADRTGATDSRQALLDACAAITAAGSGTLFVPDGLYSVNTDSYANAISLPSNCHLQLAANAVIQLAALDAGDDGHAIFRVNGTEHVKITGGKIVGRRTGPSSGESGFAIYITGGAAHVDIEGVHIVDCWGDGIYVGGTTQDSHIKIRGCTIENCRRNGITLTNAAHVEIESNTIEGITGTNPQCGIDIEPNANQAVEGVRIRGNLVKDCVGGAIKVQANPTDGDRYTRHVNVTGNEVSCPSTTGISFWGAGCTDCVCNSNDIYNTTYGVYVDNYPVRLTVVGNHIYDPATGIYLNGVQYSVFAVNNIYSPSSDGIRAAAESSQYASYNQFLGNIIHTPGGYGLNLGSVRYCEIAHNIIAASGNHGIHHSSDGFGCQISENILVGCGTTGSKAAINVALTDSNQITDNLIRAASVTTNGIVIGAGADNNIVRNNDIFDLAAAAAVADSGTGTVTTSGNRTA